MWSPTSVYSSSQKFGENLNRAQSRFSVEISFYDWIMDRKREFNSTFTTSAQTEAESQSGSPESFHRIRSRLIWLMFYNDKIYHSIKKAEDVVAKTFFGGFVRTPVWKTENSRFLFSSKLNWRKESLLTLKSVLYDSAMCSSVSDSVQTVLSASLWHVFSPVIGFPCPSMINHKMRSQRSTPWLRPV